MKKIVYSAIHVVIASCAIGVIVVNRPFTYVDNVKTTITCTNNGASFEIGPNFIYILGDRIDEFNDIKARKLCAYGMVKDYGNTLVNPEKANYTLKPVYAQDQAWTATIFLGVVAYIIQVFLFEIVYFILVRQKGHIAELLLGFFYKLIY